jgi:chemotaxis protein histidine kinase CheA
VPTGRRANKRKLAEQSGAFYVSRSNRLYQDRYTTSIWERWMHLAVMAFNACIEIQNGAEWLADWHSRYKAVAEQNVELATQQLGAATHALEQQPWTLIDAKVVNNEGLRGALATAEEAAKALQLATASAEKAAEVVKKQGTAKARLEAAKEAKTKAKEASKCAEKAHRNASEEDNVALLKQLRRAKEEAQAEFCAAQTANKAANDAARRLRIKQATDSATAKDLESAVEKCQEDVKEADARAKEAWNRLPLDTLRELKKKAEGKVDAAKEHVLAKTRALTLATAVFHAEEYAAWEEADRALTKAVNDAAGPPPDASDTLLPAVVDARAAVEQRRPAKEAAVAYFNTLAKDDGTPLEPSELTEFVKFYRIRRSTSEAATRTFFAGLCIKKDKLRDAVLSTLPPGFHRPYDERNGRLLPEAALPAFSRPKAGETERPAPSPYVPAFVLDGALEEFIGACDASNKKNRSRTARLGAAWRDRKPIWPVYSPRKKEDKCSIPIYMREFQSRGGVVGQIFHGMRVAEPMHFGMNFGSSDSSNGDGAAPASRASDGHGVPAQGPEPASAALPDRGAQGAGHLAEPAQAKDGPAKRKRQPKAGKLAQPDAGPVVFQMRTRGKGDSRRRKKEEARWGQGAPGDACLHGNTCRLIRDVDGKYYLSAARALRPGAVPKRITEHYHDRHLVAACDPGYV